MATSGKERVQATRRRQRLGLHLMKVEISDDEIAHLARLGYGARADDPQSMARAVESFVADSVLNGGRP